jgi:hypothetical protein
MPRDGATTFSDLIGKLNQLTVACDKCGRIGHYRLRGLILERGREGEVIDLLDGLAADCSRKIAHNMNDPCGARCPDLPKVL